MLELIRDQDLKNLLQQARTIAIIGAKDKPGQPVDNVGRYLIDAGYRVVPVHPKRQNVWGLETWKSILDIPFPVDIIDLFRASDYCPAHAEEVLKLNYTPMCFWMQLGIRSQEAADILKKKPVMMVQDKCIKIEHQRLKI
ncbi:MAG: CoA-binding protein [Desulfonatronovibrio sp. MSAO_Bac4]|nr:MAG: CoA-binding protein [Desulfonatronovibrio sp. MSAO_Bac4]